MKKQINVVGAALIENRLVLATKRDDNRVLGALWEFPGGKIEKDESPQQALKRELEEEFGDEIAVGSQVGETVSHEYDFGIVNLSVYFAKFLTHNFDLIAHSRVEWTKQADLSKLKWADADKLVVPALINADLEKVKFSEW